MENGALVRQLLAWIEERPRTYDETMEAWKTSCPRLSVWEDALRDGFVQIESDSDRAHSKVTLTNEGRAVLTS
jgi:hypothetical protein